MLKHYFYILLSFITLSGCLLAMEERTVLSRDELTRMLFGSDSEDEESLPINLHVKHVHRASEERARAERQAVIIMAELQAINSNILDQSFSEVLSEYSLDIIVKYLTYKSLKKEAVDLNQQDNQGKTILMRAIEEKNEDLLKFLIEQGASVNTVDGDGRTAIHFATDNNNEQLLDYLAHHGADVNISDKADQTPLYLAITKIYPLLVECLIKHKVDVNKKTSKTTPLHLAFKAYIDSNDQSNQQALYFIAQLLLNAGADQNATDDSNKTPSKLVIESKNFALVQLIMSQLTQNHSFQS